MLARAGGLRRPQLCLTSERLAGAGGSETAITAFGPRWNWDKFEPLQALFDEHGRC